MVRYIYDSRFIPTSYSPAILYEKIALKEGPPMKTPVTRDVLKNHLTYSLWKYLLLAVVAIFGWNLIYTATQYQVPEEKKIILGAYAYGDGALANLYLEQVRAEVLPEMEQISAQFIMPDEMYGAMILSTRVAARECDIYLLPRDQFQSYASQGAFMPLDKVLPELVTDLEAAGIHLNRGVRAVEETGEKHQFGIPCADLPGMAATLQCDVSDMYIAIFLYTGNDDNTIRFFDYFVRDMLNEPVAVELPAA